MHTQTEKTSSSRPPGSAPFLHTATGLGLYLLTLSFEVLLGASMRWLLIFLGASTAGPIAPIGLSAATLAWIGALAPIGHSALALVRPGSGRIWRRRRGARHPSQEEKMAIDDAFAQLCTVDGQVEQPSAIYVLDDPLPGAAVRGQALLLTRTLIETESLPAILAHELGHLRSIDGRLTEALDRFAIWEDPLSPDCGSKGAARFDFDSDPNGRLLWGCLRWTIRLAGGGIGHQFLSPFWAAHWRAREYAADAHAAALGEAEDLAQRLADFELQLDCPRPGLPFNQSEHPPVAHRIERLTNGLLAVSK